MFPEKRLRQVPVCLRRVLGMRKGRFYNDLRFHEKRPPRQLHSGREGRYQIFYLNLDS